MTTPLEVLAQSKYMLLNTFRRDGTAVATPVWVVRIADELMVWTNPTAGKVKRIRRDGHVEIGPCTRSGRPLGYPVPASARILDPGELDAVMAALIDKYGVVARLTQLPDRINAMLSRPPQPRGGIGLVLV
ncbi:PPOX class probable F420-dependent enzyme [Nakamurella sp. UYEF19]|uniref:PPOX class F420-dependent oxidoreductase n=1 Tax=Nakamurella sp. UYEF19 TaxID=1756392 RepID=UPI003393C28B